jgi:hypothetical protein
MEESPWEAYRPSASQEIPRILRNPEGSVPHLQEPTTCPYPGPAQSSPLPPSQFLKIHFNISFQSTPDNYST